jgi:hypothetical protein
MTELKPSMMLRYFTNELGRHYTATVLKDNKILSLKRAGEKDKTIYDSLIHWFASLPDNVTISDLDIKERETSPKAPTSLKKDTITLKDIAPNYDLFRFLLTYEAYSLKNSLASIDNIYKFETRTYVQDAEGNLHPVKYNRALQRLYSEHHDILGKTLEEIGFPAGADIYVKVPGVYYNNRRYRDWSFDKAKFPFTLADYESFYNAKFAFVTTPILNYTWGQDKPDESYYHTLICNYLKEEGYYIYTQFYRNYASDSIFVNKLYKYLAGNIVTVIPTFCEVIISNYNPLGFVKIPFKESDEIILEEIKTILE